MINIAVITIGSRDVKINEDFIPKNILEEKNKKKKVCRELGKYLFENYSKFKDKIEFPIFSPFWNNLKEQEVKIDKIFLIATDQSDSEYSVSDTIYYAKLLKRELERKNNKVNIFPLEKDINNLTKNYGLFKKLLNKVDYQNIERFYLLPVGGMPNINTALIMASIRIMKEKVIQYSVTRDKTTIIVPFTKKFLLEIEKDKIKSALNKYFFASVMEISSNLKVKKFANVAYSMSIFNHSKAKKLIDELMMEYLNDDLTPISEIINDAKNKNEARIKELFYTAIIKIKQEQYVDALLRLYNFADNLLFSKVYELYDLKFDPDKNFEKWWKDTIRKIQNSYPNIEEKLGKINNGKADMKRSGIPLNKALIEFKDNKSEIFEIVDPLLIVCQLRNKSIGAHGFEGISIEKINGKLADYKMDLDKLIAEIENTLNYSFETSIYCKIKKLIINEIDK